MKVKSVILAVCILSLSVPAEAKHYPNPPPSMKWIRTVPIILEPIEATVLGAFWAAAAAVSVLVDVLEEMAEPLESYESGIQHVVGSTSATISWPDGEYPTRDIDAERWYDYEPLEKRARWFIKTTYTTIFLNGNIESVVNYSTEPPVINDFNQMDIHYNRIGLSGAGQNSFSYDAYETVTAYCVSYGTKVWIRPVMSIVTGFKWDPTWRDDILYHVPTTLYEDRHYLMIPRGVVMLYKPHWDPQTEIFQLGVTTLYFST